MQKKKWYVHAVMVQEKIAPKDMMQLDQISWHLVTFKIKHRTFRNSIIVAKISVAIPICCIAEFCSRTIGSRLYSLPVSDAVFIAGIHYNLSEISPFIGSKGEGWTLKIEGDRLIVCHTPLTSISSTTMKAPMGDGSADPVGTSTRCWKAYTSYRDTTVLLYCLVIKRPIGSKVGGTTW